MNDGRSYTQKDYSGSYTQKGNCWSIYYRYTAEQQYEQFQQNLRRERALKKHEKDYVKEKRLRPKHWQKPIRHKEYKPPTIDEPEIGFKDLCLDHEFIFDEREQ